MKSTSSLHSACLCCGALLDLESGEYLQAPDGSRYCSPTCWHAQEANTDDYLDAAKNNRHEPLGAGFWSEYLQKIMKRQTYGVVFVIGFLLLAGLDP